MNSVAIDTVESHKDLGILFDNQLKFHSHTTNISNKANRLLELIRRSFDHLDSKFILIYTILNVMFSDYISGGCEASSQTTIISSGKYTNEVFEIA